MGFGFFRNKAKVKYSSFLKGKMVIKNAFSLINMLLKGVLKNISHILCKYVSGHPKVQT